MKFIKDIEGNYIRTDMIDRIWICGGDEVKPFTVTATMKESEGLEMYYDLYESEEKSQCVGYMKDLIKSINRGLK